MVDVHRQIREAFNQKELRFTRSLLGVLVNFLQPKCLLKVVGAYNNTVLFAARQAPELARSFVLYNKPITCYTFPAPNSDAGTSS